MAVDVRVSIDFSAFDAALTELGPKNFNAAAMIAVNETARQVNSKAASLVAKEAGFKVADVRKRLRMIKATRTTLTAIVRGSGRAMPLSTFGARQVAKGVSANAWGHRKVYPGAFLATMKTGHRGVFKRLGDDRLPIKELFGPGVASTMGQPAIRAALEQLISERLPINLQRQFERRLRALSGKAKLSAAARQKLR